MATLTTALPVSATIISPTGASPVVFEASALTDVTVVYEMVDSVVDPLSLTYGMYVGLDIIHEDDPTPVASFLHPNVLTTGVGETRVFHWNGYADDSWLAPGGRYHLRVSLFDHTLTPTGWSVQEDQAVIIARTEVGISPGSDDLLSRHGAMAGEDGLNITYTLTPPMAYDEVVARVFDPAGSEIARASTTSDLDGDLRWNGLTHERDAVAPGSYNVAVELKRRGESLGSSVSHAFTVYEVDLQAAGVAESDEETPGVSLPAGQETAITLAFRPAGSMLGGTVRLTDLTDTGSMVFSSTGTTLDLAGGIDVPLTGMELVARSTRLDGVPVELLAEYLPPGAPAGKTETDRLVLARSGIDMDVDADRDGVVEDSFEDDVDEDQWAVGSANKGAIVLVNADDDDADHLPDNWASHPAVPHTAWDSEPNDSSINSAADAEDIAPLVVRQVNLPAFPDSANIVLSVSVPADEPAYFARFAANERIRIFYPNQASGGAHSYAAGAAEIIGPDVGARAEFVVTPGAGQQDIAIFLGDQDATFGIEGLVHGAMVDVLIAYQDATGLYSEDRVRVRNAPFILFDQVKAVDTDAGAGETVFVEDLDASNLDLRDVLTDVFTPGHVDQASTGDRWHQDGYDPGYQSAPYRAMPMILGLNRGMRRGELLNPYTQEVLLRPGVGLVHDFQYLPDIESCGGNLEATPGDPQRFFHGNDMHDEITAFLAAQGVQRQLALDTRFLSVGHVDELVSYAPDGRHVLVSSPEVAWALLLIAADIDDSAPMLQQVDPVGPAGMSVGDVIADYEDFNFNTVLSSPHLPAFRAELGLGSAAGVPQPVAGNASPDSSLARVGGLIGFMDGDQVRTFLLTFRAGGEFDVEFRDADGPWQSDGTGRYGEHFVSESRTAFILARWWQSPIPTIGDTYTFSVDPRSSFIEVPVIFHESPFSPGAVAFTKNNVNSLVSGETIVTAQAVGPVVDWGEGPRDIFAYYIERIFGRAGYSEVVFADDLAYHNYSGSIHCGTNVLRRIPTRHWWE
jgi:protein-arginine deiminase